MSLQDGGGQSRSAGMNGHVVQTGALREPLGAREGDHVDADLEIVRGTVKWFNPGEGFGFIVSKDVNGDVLLHRSVLEAFGVQTIQEGASVVCKACWKTKGYQAKEILEIDNATVVVSMGSTPSRRERGAPREAAVLVARGVKGTVKWFSRPKGYGFIVSKNVSGDIFVHMDVVRSSGLRELRNDQQVLFDYGRTQNGFSALSVQVTGRSTQSPDSDSTH